MNEGDVCTVFSQYGEIADVLLVKDQMTRCEIEKQASQEGLRS